MIQNILMLISVVSFSVFLYILYKYIIKKRLPANPELLKQAFPQTYRAILTKHVLYYKNLPRERKAEFENRVLRFLSEKRISGVEVDVTDEDKLLVAASAIIPMFAFPYYNYPKVHEVLLYPNSFDTHFQTSDNAQARNILGMVGDGYMNGEVLLSKPDLESAFDGLRHRQNVGIHEFTHLIDRADGTIDGVPDILIEHSYSLVWLKEIKREMEKIRKGHSDIRPYALTNAAEFLAVVSEYFFDNPEKMKAHHPELYADMVQIFHQSPDEFV